MQLQPHLCNLDLDWRNGAIESKKKSVVNGRAFEHWPNSVCVCVYWARSFRICSSFDHVLHFIVWSADTTKQKRIRDTNDKKWAKLRNGIVHNVCVCIFTPPHTHTHTHICTFINTHPSLKTPPIQFLSDWIDLPTPRVRERGRDRDRELLFLPSPRSFARFFPQNLIN